MPRLYCPKGCQIYEAPEGVEREECGACGSVMTKDERKYNDALQEIEDQQIAEIEKCR